MRFLLFAILFLSAVSTNAQATIEFKPGRTDSARWKYEVNLLNGGGSVSTEPYDTLPAVIAYGELLYNQGGFIDGHYIAPRRLSYTDEVIEYATSNVTSLDIEAAQVADALASIGSGEYNLLKYDTITNADFIGTYFILSASCGFDAFTSVTVAIQSDANGHYLELTGGDAPVVVFNVSPGVVRFDVPNFNYGPIELFRASDIQWRTAYNCTLSRQ